MNSLFGYDPQDTWLHRLTGATKMLAFLGISVIVMASYDTRFVCAVMLASIILFLQAKIHWHQISLVIKIITIFAVVNLLLVYVFSPPYGVGLYGSKHVLIHAGYLTLTQEQLFYELNLALKYIVTVPLALIFLITTNPSEFAASLNKLHVSYRISYSVALALRYIPDVQANFRQISLAQQARGYELSRKAKLFQRLKGMGQILMPLIFTSLDRIDQISQAMELRRFGTGKRRTWYMDQPLRTPDWLVLGGVVVITVVGLVLFRVNGGRFFNPFLGSNQ